MILRVLIFICSIVTSTNLYGQIRINRLAVGIDPRSLSMLFSEHNASSHSFYYNTWQANAELFLPMRTSFVFSYGYTKAHLQKFENTLDYHSQGNYAKFGLNFNVSNFKQRGQGLIGWRIGLTRNYTEDATVILEGNGWKNTLRDDLGQRSNNYYWGEFILEERVRVSMNKSSFLSNFWFSVQGSLRFNKLAPSSQNYESYNIPGLGRYTVICPGFAFNLAYYFNFKHKVEYPETPTHKNVMHKRKYGRILDRHY